MHPQLLCQFDVFAGLGPAALARAAAHCRLLKLPARRWVVKPGRRLPGDHRYFLVAGTVQLIGPDGVLDAADPGARRAVYPGVAGLATVTAATLLRVDSGVAGLLADCPLPPVPRVRHDPDCWEVRLLTSPVLRRLTPGVWQRLLRTAERREVAPGELLIRGGERGDVAYALCSGRARVEASGSGTPLAALGPGEWCGEDAVLSGRPRNATVRMVGAGRVLVVPGPLFVDELAAALVPVVAAAGSAQRLHVGPTPAPGDVHLPIPELRERLHGLDRAGVWCVVGGAFGERLLGAYLLARAGFSVSALRGAA